MSSCTFGVCGGGGCFADGHPCSKDSACCSGKCAGGCVIGCTLDGAQCGGDGDCCSGNCAGGTCQP